MRKINSKFVTSFVSEAGSLLQNRDYFGFVELDKYAIYVIADGIDNEVDMLGAKIAVASIISYFSESPSMRSSFLEQVLRRANEELINQSKNMRLKASVTIVVTDYVKIRYAQAGNTRFHLFREGFLREQSEDQSLTQQLVNEEKLPLDKVAKHQERNNLYCYLGQDERLNPFVSKKVKLKNGDIITLSTKGIWENIDLGELTDGVVEAKEPQEAVDHVEELILSKQPKELENYTFAAIFVDKTYENPKRKQKIKKIIMTAIPIILVVAIIFSVWYFRRKQRLDQISSMNYYIESGHSYIEDMNFIRAKEEYKAALDIAKKLKLDQKRDYIDSYYRLAETIIKADELLYDGKYENALDDYLSAQERAYYADHLAKDYIIQQLDKVNGFIKVLELIQQGDQKRDFDDLHGARLDYQEAKNMATALYFREARQEAQEKLNQIYEEQKTREQEAAKEAQEAMAQAEEEEKEAALAQKESMEIQMNAIEMTKKGDVSYRIGSYQDAKMYYTMAQELYRQVNQTRLARELEEKIQLTEQMITQQTKSQARAQQYVADAMEMAEAGNLNDARLLYLFARDIYEAAEIEEEVKRIDEKIRAIEALIEERNGESPQVRQ